jgi:hypothetical protein
VAGVREAAANDYYLLGQGDIFFTPVGGQAYLKDLPTAEMHGCRLGGLVWNCTCHHRNFKLAK